MSVIEALIDLQETDGRIRELEVELKDLPQRKANEMARLTGVSVDLESAKAGLHKAGERVKGYESDAQALKDKIQKLKVTQAGLKSNKEYQQYSVQIDLLSHDFETTENSQLAAMDDIPSAEKRVQDAQAKFDAEKGKIDAVCAEYDERITRAQAELDECQKERVEKAKLVSDPQFMLFYERLKIRRWPVVVPLTSDNVCDGCHLVQPPSVGQLVKANAKNAAEGKSMRIVACAMCGRILYSLAD